MKNLVKSIILFIGASILFTACGPNSALTKRHYRKGYHFDYAKKANTIKSKTSSELINTQSAIVIQERVEAINEKNILVSAPVIKSTEIKIVKSPSAQKNINSANKFYKLQSKPLMVKDNKLTNYIENKVQFKKLTTAARNEDARSFFWTLILVLLILWIIGLLAGGWGLGGLINLILVIALILFILWLFRII